MGRAFFAALVFCVSTSFFGTAAQAQLAWVQVESQPSLRAGQDRARAYGQAFSDVQGFRLPGGWYTVALGPYPSPEAARTRLRLLRAQRVIPNDSFVSDGSNYGDQYWPIGSDLGGLGLGGSGLGGSTSGGTPAPEADAGSETGAAAPQPIPELPEPVDETPREARASERLLDREGREELQIALQWFGFYTAAIDGSFGRGTRGSMARWQTANGYEPTGILTTKQRADLLEQYQTALAALGLGTVDEDKAGIKITMPTGLVEFESYDYPFVRYAERLCQRLHAGLPACPRQRHGPRHRHHARQFRDDRGLAGGHR